MPVPIIAAAAFTGIVATALKVLVASFIVRLLTVLAVSLVTFTGLNSVSTQVTNYITSSQSGLSAQVAEAATLIGFTTSVNIVASAYVGAIAIRQAMGLYNRLVFGRT